MLTTPRPAPLAPSSPPPGGDPGEPGYLATQGVHDLTVRDKCGNDADLEQYRYFIQVQYLMTNEPSWTAPELKTELNRYEAELRAAGKTRSIPTSSIPSGSSTGFKGDTTPYEPSRIGDLP
jgi:hypothetical protein